jgi:hypothetical protein
MRQIVVVGEELRGFGTGILKGLRRFWSLICFFVVRLSQIGGEVESSSSESGLSAMRDFFPDVFVLSCSVDLMCFRRAFEAFSVYSIVSINL